MSCSGAQIGVYIAWTYTCMYMKPAWSSCAAPDIVNNCPSRWTDLVSAIQITWTAPERPNGMLLQYHLQLTTYDGRRVITTESVGSSAVIGQLDNSKLREYHHICGFCLLYYCLLLQLPQRMVFPTFLASLQRTRLAMELSVMSLTSQMSLVGLGILITSVVLIRDYDFSLFVVSFQF